MATIKLKRELGLFHATTIGVGLILGAGIYVLIGEATSTAGNSVWLAFVLSAVVALLTGLSYAELSSLFPKDAAEFTYTEKAFSKSLAFFIGYFVLMSAIISTATVAMGFAGYFSALFQLDHVIYIAIGVIGLFSILNYRSIKESAWANVVFTALEIIGLLIIIGLGIFFIGDVDLIEMPQEFGGVIKAAALVFFAFLGFESVVKLCEECKKPRTTIPLALLLSIAISTVLYILVAISAVSILSWEVLAASKAPLADVAASVLGPNAFVVLSIIALFSTGNTVLISLIAGSRTLYGIGENFKLLKPFHKVHPKRRTPYIAIWTVMFFSILFTFIRDIGLIAELTNFTLFVTFGVINLALIVLRYKYPNTKRKFKIPLNIGKFSILAFAGFLSCIFFIFQLNLSIILGGLGLVGIGILLYLLVAFFEKKIKF
ncbi:APC family permease [Patescibacteria group bacterium]